DQKQTPIRRSARAKHGDHAHDREQVDRRVDEEAHLAVEEVGEGIEEEVVELGPAEPGHGEGVDARRFRHAAGWREGAVEEDVVPEEEDGGNDNGDREWSERQETRRYRGRADAILRLS